MAEEKTEALPGAAVAAPAAPAADSGASIAAFYDDLAEDYTSIFADWDASMRRQADVVAELLGRYFDDATAPSATPADAAAAGDAAAGSERLNVLDCACGVGTQAIGLAMRRGPLLKTRAHSPGDAEGPLTFGCVAGSDISSGAVRRAAQEARKRGVDVVEGAEEAARCAAQLQLAVADFRHLHDVWRGSGGEARQFDVVLAFDNALPHLLRFSEVSAALASMRRCVRDGGLLALSIRDYDEIVKCVSLQLPLAGPHSRPAPLTRLPLSLQAKTLRRASTAAAGRGVGGLHLPVLAVAAGARRRRLRRRALQADARHNAAVARRLDRGGATRDVPVLPAQRADGAARRRGLRGRRVAAADVDGLLPANRRRACRRPCMTHVCDGIKSKMQ